MKSTKHSLLKEQSSAASSSLFSHQHHWPQHLRNLLLSLALMESWTCSVLVRVMKFHSSSLDTSLAIIKILQYNELNARGLNDTNCLGCCCCWWWSLWVWGVKIRTVAVTSVHAGLRFEKGLPQSVCWSVGIVVPIQKSIGTYRGRRNGILGRNNTRL